MPEPINIEIDKNVIVIISNTKQLKSKLIFYQLICVCGIDFMICDEILKFYKIILSLFSK